jgi:hypothetical protein
MSTTRTPRRIPPAALEPPFHAGDVTYQLKWIQCGKRSCAKWHGPYWYAFWRDRSAGGGSGRTRAKYIGRSLPADLDDLRRRQVR